MDPASIIGVASAAITFLDFAIELVNGSREIYCSLKGATEENAHVDLVITDLHSAAKTLSVQNARPASQHEKALADLSNKCYKKCTELLNITESLKIHDRSKWSSFKAAWKTHWKKDDIDHLHGELRDYRLTILLRLNQMQIENALEADKKLDAILLEFRRPIKDKHQIEASICSRIKQQLYFESIYRREDGIDNPEEGTLGWITDASSDYAEGDGCEIPDWIARRERKARSHARSEYISWLGACTQQVHPGMHGTAPSNPKILHISGKAGSGKSTLMRYLFKHDQTREALKTWAGPRTLILASFYFWVASGDDMQKSLNGLYRTILHGVLDQCPELAVYLFPSQWREIQRRIDKNEEASKAGDPALFRDKAIYDAFSKLVGSAAGEGPLYCFCFFIDGLDEYRKRAVYGGGYSKDTSPGFKELTGALLRWNTSAHVKICTASRPYPEFLDSLDRNQATVLHLEQVNQRDIYRYCKKAFDEDGDIKGMPISYDYLLNKITERADGVFMWAVLAVRAMIKSLSRGDSKKIQMQKLDAIPPELDSLYTMLLNQVDESDRDRSNQLFLLALFLRDQIKHFHMFSISCLDDLTDPDFPEAIPLDLTEAEKKQRDGQGRRLLNSLTHGMLVNHLINDLTFSHRTAYDYIKERRESGRLTSTALDFDQIDVWGRICVGDLDNVLSVITVVMFKLGEVRHNKRADTILRLSKRVRQIVLAKHNSKHLDTTAHPTLLIMGALALARFMVTSTPTPVDDTSVSTVNISILGYTVLSINTLPDSISFEWLLRNDWAGLRGLLTKEEQCVLALASIVYADGRGMYGFQKYVIFFDFTELYHMTSDALPCPYWMYLAALMVRYLLTVLKIEGIYGSKLFGDIVKRVVLPPGAANCKVALNDRRGTVVTLQQLLDVGPVRWKKGDTQLKEENELEEVVRHILGEPLLFLGVSEERNNESDVEMVGEADGEADGESDDKPYDDRTWPMSDDTKWIKFDYEFRRDSSKKRFKYIEFEGFKLDADFKIYFACPDLFK